MIKTQLKKRSFISPASNALATALVLSVSFTHLTLAHADDYATVCGNSQALTGQKATYCNAAKQAKDASKKEGTLSLIYGAVAGTCAASCAGWITTAYICEGASLSAAAADVVLTKNFTSALMAGGAVAFKVMEGGDSGTSSGAKKFACWATAASAALNSVMHGMSKSNDEKTVSSNLQAAKNVNDSSANALNFGTPSFTTSTGTATTLATTTGTATTLKPTSESSSADPSNGCGDAGSVGGAVACAATADPNVATLVASPDFQKAFEKSSGMKLEDYLKNGGNVSANDAIKAAAGAVMGDDGSVKLGNAIAAVEQAVPDLNSQNALAYAAKGSSAGGSGNDDIASMMNGLMGKLMPKNEEQRKSGVSEVKFSGPARNLASVTAEDPTVSLFERVAYRYSHVTPRLLSDPSQHALSEWSGAAPKATGATATQRN